MSATRVPGVRGAARKAVGAAAWGQVYGRAQAALPSFLREQNVTARVRRFAERFPPLALARRAWAGGKSLLLRGSRFALPFFLAGWGCAVQAGRLAARDTPRVLLYLLPLKWAEVVPEPSAWLVGRARRAYQRLLVEPVKGRVGQAAREGAARAGWSKRDGARDQERR